MDWKNSNLLWIGLSIMVILALFVWLTYRAVPIGLSTEFFQIGEYEVEIDVESNGDNGTYRMNVSVDGNRVGRFSGNFDLDFWQEDFPGYYRYAWIDGDLKLDLVIEPSHDEAHFVSSISGELQPVRR